MLLIHKFFIRILLWIPICFAVWYFVSILLTIPLAIIVHKIMTWSLPHLIEAVRQNGNHLIVFTSLNTDIINDKEAIIGDVIFKLNPLIYGYSFPFYSALLLATPINESKKFKYWLIAISILLLIQSFGVSANIFKDIAFLNAAAKAKLGLPEWGHDVIVLAYQFGYLILPSVTPIVIWIGQFKESLAMLYKSA
jgi:hypothetical protein